VGNLAVRVVPRSRDAHVDVTAAGVVIRVRAAAEHGRATDEARRALAGSLNVPPSAIRLLRGARSRDKVFQIEGMTGTQALQRLRADSS
jgi:uncharacterized protein YggU (UPF0235/DUF167 family)